MVTQWILETHGDPLATLRRFLHELWEQASLNAMLVPLDEPDGADRCPSLIEDSAQLNHVNPFKPLMTVNNARFVPELLLKKREAQIGVLLRPCEMRALIEMTKHSPLNLERLLTICLDCLGTLPPDEFQWRAQRKGSHLELSEETLRFSRQGGILAYRYRSACQICPSPNARGGHINIEIIGLPIRQYLLIETNDETTVAKYQLDRLTDGEAPPETVEQRKHVLAKLRQRNEHTLERVIRGIADSLPATISQLAEQLERCLPCQECLNTCPICTVDYPSRNAEGKYERNQITRWLISCVGCGICEQRCPQRLPLSAIFGYVQRQLAEALDYTPGHSYAQPLPLR